MSTEPAQKMSNKAIDPSVAWESHGVLARTAHQGALFSLCLAMFETSIVEPLHLEKAPRDEENASQKNLLSTNFYRRPHISAQDADWKAMATLGELMASDVKNGLLFQAMYPQPLALTNDAQRLDDAVVHNSSLAAQKRLQASFTSTFIEDNTLLYDVLSAKKQNNHVYEHLNADLA